MNQTKENSFEIRNLRKSEKQVFLPYHQPRDEIGKILDPRKHSRDVFLSIRRIRLFLDRGYGGALWAAPVGFRLSLFWHFSAPKYLFYYAISSFFYCILSVFFVENIHTCQSLSFFSQWMASHPRNSVDSQKMFIFVKQLYHLDFSLNVGVKNHFLLLDFLILMIDKNIRSRIKDTHLFPMDAKVYENINRFTSIFQCNNDTIRLTSDISIPVLGCIRFLRKSFS